jgi:hypothetical protein
VVFLNILFAWSATGQGIANDDFGSIFYPEINLNRLITPEIINRMTNMMMHPVQPSEFELLFVLSILESL